MGICLIEILKTVHNNNIHKVTDKFVGMELVLTQFLRGLESSLANTDLFDTWKPVVLSLLRH